MQDPLCSNKEDPMNKAILLMAAMLSVTPVLAADLCRAIALRDVAAIESPDSVLARGEYDEAITVYSVNKLTGMTYFCSHGGYCYPTHVRIKGKRVEALRLINCKIGTVGTPDGDEVTYSVDVVRSKNSKDALQFDDLDNRLIELGLCNACAGNVAEMYLKHPSSQCAQLTKQALEGNPEALERLQSFPDYCHAWKK
jgi:hypothetical protein